MSSDGAELMTAKQSSPRANKLSVHQRNYNFTLTFMKRTTLLLLSASLLGISACTTTYITPISVAETRRVDVTNGQEIPAGEKTFTLPKDWQWGPWVVRRGATITFREDGTGIFSCRLYSQFNTTPENLHFQAIAYSKDGNRLFAFPGRDTGLSMAIRTPFTDYPYDVPFGYDKRHFEFIDSVKFYGRLRLQKAHVGQFAAKRSSFTAASRFDPTGSPTNPLPPTP